MSREITRKSPARITLALDIVRKISDGPLAGYHELGTVKHKLDLADRITVKPASDFSLTCSDISIPTDGRNVCAKAYEILKHEYDIKESASIHIEKQIPSEGGLAGGSSNAATTIFLLENLWGLDISSEQRVAIGKNIGMDVPFFFLPENTAYDTETTGVLKPIKTKLQLYFVLVFPSFGVSTKDAYNSINYLLAGQHIAQTKNLQTSLKMGRVDDLYKNIHNDFELNVFNEYPELAKIQQSLIDAGAFAAGMSGSGSTLYGIAQDKEHTKKIASRLSHRTSITHTLTA